jgi:hypothetical protein
MDRLLGGSLLGGGGGFLGRHIGMCLLVLDNGAGLECAEGGGAGENSGFKEDHQNDKITDQRPQSSEQTSDLYLGSCCPRHSLFPDLSF